MLENKRPKPAQRTHVAAEGPWWYNDAKILRDVRADFAVWSSKGMLKRTLDIASQIVISETVIDLCRNPRETVGLVPACFSLCRWQWLKPQVCIQRLSENVLCQRKNRQALFSSLCCAPGRSQGRSGAVRWSGGLSRRPNGSRTVRPPSRWRVPQTANPGRLPCQGPPYLAVARQRPCLEVLGRRRPVLQLLRVAPVAAERRLERRGGALGGSGCSLGRHAPRVDAATTTGAHVTQFCGCEAPV